MAELSARAKCLKRIAKQRDAPMTDARAAEIDEAMNAHLRRMAAADPQRFESLTPEQRMADATDAISKQIVAQAAETKRRAELQAGVAKVRMDGLKAHAERLAERLPTRKNHASRAVRYLLQAAEAREGGMKKMFSGWIYGALKVSEQDTFGFLRDPEKARSLHDSIWNNGTGPDAQINGIARDFIGGMDRIRMYLNNLGADIGKLDYGWFPREWEPQKIARLGKTAREAAEKFAEMALPEMDRNTFRNTDGSLMSDEAVKRVLTDSGMSVLTGGLHKLDPGDAGITSSSITTKLKRHRELHFKDADAEWRMLEQFTTGDFHSQLQSYLTRMSGNAMMLQLFGPVPEATFKQLSVLAKQIDGIPSKEPLRPTGALRVHPEHVWRNLTGALDQGGNPRNARFWSGVRQFLAATRLQSLFLSSVPDIAIVNAALKSNGGTMSQLMDMLATIHPDEVKDQLGYMGLAADSMINHTHRAIDSSDWKSGWTSRLAMGTHKLGLATAWSDALRGGIQAMQSGLIHKLTTLHGWDDLPDANRNILMESGVTAENYAIWKEASPVRIGDVDILSGDAIGEVPDAKVAKHIQPELRNSVEAVNRARNNAMAAFMGAIDHESKMGVVEGNITSRSVSKAAPAGTLWGNISRNLLLFTDYSLGVMSRGEQRMMSLPDGDFRMRWAVTTMVQLTLLGALIVQMKQLRDGNDPRNMNPADTNGAKFWLSSMMQGGGIGFAGDFLYTTLKEGPTGKKNLTKFAGPVYSAFGDASNFVTSNIFEGLAGEETHAVGEAISLLDENAPLVNLWFTRGIWKHMVTQELQEWADPGYLDRQRQRTRKNYGVEQWWEYGEALPYRAPDIQNVTGANE